MSLPRQIDPGSTYMVTRRCTQRQFLLLPSKLVNRVFLYCLAFAAMMTGIRVHVAVVMSNHYHLIVTDPRGLLPKFVELLNKYVAKCLNASYGRWENFWAGAEQASYVKLVTPEAMLSKCIYALTNPVTAGLVSRGDAWPGVRLFQPGTYTIKRPKIFFRDEGTMPKSLRLDVSAPTLAEPLASKEAYQRLCDAVAQAEATVRNEFVAQRRRFLGRRGIRAQSIHDTPTTREPRRKLSPRVATRNKWRRIEALQRLKSFVHDYRRAYERWRAGHRDVVFPPGTYAMRLVHHAACGP